MFKKITLAAALSVSAVGAFAADEPKWYAGVDVIRADFKDRATQDLRGGLFAGYRINDTWAVEGSAALLGGDDIGQGRTTTVDQYAISGIASVPLGSSRFKAFGRLGVNYLDIKLQGPGARPLDNKLSALYGIGLSYDVTPTISGRVEVQKASTDVNKVSAGLAFKF